MIFILKLDSKPAGDIFQKCFSYIWYCIYIFKEFFQRYFGVQYKLWNHEIKDYISEGHDSDIDINSVLMALWEYSVVEGHRYKIVSNGISFVIL